MTAALVAVAARRGPSVRGARRCARPGGAGRGAPERPRPRPAPAGRHRGPDTPLRDAPTAAAGRVRARCARTDPATRRRPARSAGRPAQRRAPPAAHSRRGSGHAAAERAARAGPTAQRVRHRARVLAAALTPGAWTTARVWTSSSATPGEDPHNLQIAPEASLLDLVFSFPTLVLPGHRPPLRGPRARALRALVLARGPRGAWECARPGRRTAGPVRDLRVGSLGAVSERRRSPGLELVSQGKVREIYEVGEDRLLMVASDRISTYDVVHPTPIPDKGKVLTGLSDFWFERTGQIVPNHLISYTDVPDEVRGRAMLVERLEMVPGRVRRARLHHRLGLEGLPGAPGRSAGSSCPPACGSPSSCPSRSSRPRPRPSSATTTRTSTSTAPPRSSATAPLLEELRRLSLALYEFGAAHARERGIILADTKFEFGRRAGRRRIVLGDEVLTPDSSRFWPADGYEPGRVAAELRQAVRARLGLELRLGQVAARAADPRRGRRGHARALPRGLRAHRRRAVLGLARAFRGVRARVLIRPKAGHPRPAGPGGRAGAAGARLRRASRNVHVGRLVELEVRRSRRRCRRCASGCWRTR